MEKIASKISKEFYVIETLAKLQYCSEEVTVFLLWDNAASMGYSIIFRKGPVTNVKIFRGPVTPIKSCK